MISYTLIGIVAILIIVFLLARNSSSKKDTTQKATNNSEKSKETTLKDNPYLDMRNMALSITSEQLGLPASEDAAKVFGVVADLDMTGATVTLTSYITGDTSLYLSTGGGFIGAGQHEDVQKVVKKFIEKAQTYSSKGKQYESTELPKAGTANFYFLSDSGNTKIVETLSNLESGNSEYSDLFYELNQVMTAIRLQSGD